jgi:hypothetical protein
MDILPRENETLPPKFLAENIKQQPHDILNNNPPGSL